jgi:PhnB protein
MQLSPYIFFQGTCEEALNFYVDVFGGEIVSLNRFEGSPIEGDAAMDDKNKVMHATFKTGDWTFMAADGSDPRPAGNVALSLATEDEAEGDRIFAGLSAGATITMPMETVFWGGKFGMLTDRYGVMWMISAGH